MAPWLELMVEKRGPTFDAEADSPWSKFEISSFFPKVEKEIEIFQDVCLRQSFALVFFYFPSDQSNSS